MKFYTDIQYVQIALANAAGFEKSISCNEHKILWAEMSDLEEWRTKAKDKMAYANALQAYKDARAGIPSGFIMGFDAGASGFQMAAVLTGDLEAAKRTGLAKSDTRGNFYKDIQDIVGAELDLDPDDVKSAVMTAMYMSEAVPEQVFGAENMDVFYNAVKTCAPKCFELLNYVLPLHAQLGKDCYTFTAPNGYVAYTPVLVTDSLTTVNMLGGSFKYETKSIAFDERYKGLLANICHFTDAFVSDEVGDRVNHDVDIVKNGIDTLNRVLQDYTGEADRTTVPSIRWVNDMGMGLYARISDIKQQFSMGQLVALRDLAIDVLNTESIPTFARHDEFCSYPAGMNAIRYQYQKVMSEIAASNLLSDILSSICGEPVQIAKQDISTEVLNGAYGLN